MEMVPLSQLPAFVRSVLGQLAAHSEHATLLTLQGELGAGKTAFVQALGRELRIAQTMQSPTYVIMKSYDIPKSSSAVFEHLVHLDLYRLEAKKDLAALKLETVMNRPKTLVCVEWPERAEGVLPKADLALHFSSEGASAEERYIEEV